MMIVIKLKINFCFKFVWVMFITDIGFSSIQSTPAELVKNFPDSLKTNHSGEPLFIDILDFKNTDIKDVMRAIANKYKINIFVDDDIDVRVTVHMNNVLVEHALQFLVKQAGLVFDKQDEIYQITEKPSLPKPPLKIEFENNLLSVDVKGEQLEEVIHEIARKSNTNIVINRGVQGCMNGFLHKAPFVKGLRTFLNANGFDLQTQNDIFIIDWGYNDAPGSSDANNAGKMWVTAQDSLISFNVRNAELNELINAIMSRLDADLIIYGELKGKITAKCSNVHLLEALNYIFKGSKYTFRQDGKVFMIGDEEVKGITSSKLFKLDHVKAEVILESLPKEMIKGAEFHVIKEHNGLMVIGTQDVILQMENYIQEIDHPIPQILIEALVVDYNLTDFDQFDIQAGLGKSDTSAVLGLRQLFPKVQQHTKGEFINDIITQYGPGLGLPKVGKLPTDFYVKVQALAREQKAKIRSRPQIATLNGNTASISIGTTQYFILNSNTPYPATNQIYVQEFQRFETIKAEMRLEITPWVSAAGEITVEIHPEFSTPRKSLSPEVPPTIDHRILDSTVRLREGETIILGGLVQEVNSYTYEKFPFLGDIPLLGYLFRNRSKNTSNSELMIYVTPHLYYHELSKVNVDGFIE